MPAPAHRRGLAHYAAPLAFLAAVTIVVLLVRSGLGGGTAAPATTTLGTVARAGTVATAAAHRKRHAKKRHVRAQYYIVQSGDTFGTIAAKEGTSLARIEALNPGVSSSTLAVGQKIRVK